MAETINQILSAAIFLLIPVSSVVAIIGAYKHLTNELTLFYDKTDALMTIFSPLFAVILTAPFSQRLENGYYLVLVLLVWGYFLLCSFKYSAKANMPNKGGMYVSCISKIAAPVLVFIGMITAWMTFAPSRHFGATEFEQDYINAKQTVATAAAGAALAAAFVGLARIKKFSSPIRWLMVWK